MAGGAQRYWRVESLVDGLIAIPVLFTINGVAAPDAVRGRHFTVARLGVGTFRLTFSEMKFKIVFPVGSPFVVDAGANENWSARWSAINPTAPGGMTVDIVIQSPIGTDAEPDNTTCGAFLFGVQKSNNVNITP